MVTAYSLPFILCEKLRIDETLGYFYYYELTISNLILGSYVLSHPILFGHRLFRSRKRKCYDLNTTVYQTPLCSNTFLSGSPLGGCVDVLASGA